jgi:hypothetical protein
LKHIVDGRRHTFRNKRSALRNKRSAHHDIDHRLKPPSRQPEWDSSDYFAGSRVHACVESKRAPVSGLILPVVPTHTYTIAGAHAHKHTHTHTYLPTYSTRPLPYHSMQKGSMIARGGGRQHFERKQSTEILSNKRKNAVSSRSMMMADRNQQKCSAIGERSCASIMPIMSTRSLLQLCRLLYSIALAFLMHTPQPVLSPLQLFRGKQAQGKG